MKKNKGIGMKLGALVICITLFVIGMSLFTWKHFAFSNSQNQKKLNEIQTYNQLTDNVRQAQINFKIQVQEWKNTLIRGHEKEDFEKYYELFSNQQQNVQKQLQVLKQTMIQLELDISLMEELIQSHQKLYKEYEQAIKSYDSTDVNSYRIVDDLVKGIDRKATENMDQLVVQIQALTQDRTEQMVQQEKEYIQTFNIKISSITIGSIGVIILITLVIALTYKNITRFIIELNRVMESVLRGDLTVRGEVSNKDELGDITIRFNEVLDNIQELLKESQDISGIVASSSFKVNQAIEAMSEASQHISYTMMEITKGTREQSNQVRGSHESMVKVIDGIERVMTNMIQSESQVKVTQDVVDKGTQALLQQRNKMNDTKGATERVEQVIEKLKLV